jgi:isoleucyl-tRNA synthetase
MLRIAAKSKEQIAKRKDLLKILKDEINVKEIVFDNKIREEVKLDTTITPELKEEGILRELVRMVQDLRQKAGLKPKDRVALYMELPDAVRLVAQKHGKVLRSEVGAKSVEYRKSAKFSAEIATKFGGADTWLGVRK